jgi:uncharacterized protein CbrC (UPF0167 family)
MSDDQAAPRAAQAILRRLSADQRIETAHPAALVREIEEALAPYERALDAIVASVLETAASLATAQAELDRRALAEGVPLDEEALPELLAKLCALLLASANVDELFVDDAELSRVVRAALLDYLPAVASKERAKLAAALVKPRELRPEAPKPSSIADDGYAFPLFEGPLDSAVVDEAGPCAFCAAPSDVRFEDACYACFRAGRAVAHAVETELGPVRAGAAEGAPKGAEELLRTPAYETWQGARWLFCCERPMIFVGAMSQAMLDRLREQEQTQEEVIAKLLQVDAREAHRRTSEVLKGRIGMYVFRCAACEKRRAHWDRA